MEMNERREKIAQKINTLPKGSLSPSKKYWCVTCKKFFILDNPVCPFMTKMCVNTPIAIENFNPESSEGIERIGLFYPKFPQKLLSEAVIKDYLKIGAKLAEEYINFLRDWMIKYENQPMQTLKSFLIIISGVETAQRVNEKELTFVFLDIEKNWDKEKLFNIVNGAIPVLAKELNIKQEIKLDSMDIIGDRPIGKYYCSACGMLFEFGMKKDKVTCPLMAQKCMFTPTNIEDSNYKIEELIKIYRITPDIFKRFMSVIDNPSDKIKSKLKDILRDEWHLEIAGSDLELLSELLGI
jgi:DNA-directed RNA polymerase subunit RPC12/RpoP